VNRRHSAPVPQQRPSAIPESHLAACRQPGGHPQLTMIIRPWVIQGGLRRLRRRLQWGRRDLLLADTRYGGSGNAPASPALDLDPSRATCQMSWRRLMISSSARSTPARYFCARSTLCRLRGARPPGRKPRSAR
jgi:hypothetical protein